MISDTVFVGLVVVGLGTAVTQAMVGYELLLINRQARVAEEHRLLAIRQNEQLLRLGSEMIGELTRRNAEHTEIVEAIRHLEAKR